MTTFLSKTVADRQYTDALKDDIKGRVKKIEDAITAAQACTVRQLKLETCCALCIFSYLFAGLWVRPARTTSFATIPSLVTLIANGNLGRAAQSFPSFLDLLDCPDAVRPRTNSTCET